MRGRLIAFSPSTYSTGLSHTAEQVGVPSAGRWVRLRATGPTGPTSILLSIRSVVRTQPRQTACDGSCKTPRWMSTGRIASDCATSVTCLWRREHLEPEDAEPPALHAPAVLHGARASDARFDRSVTGCFDRMKGPASTLAFFTISSESGRCERQVVRRQSSEWGCRQGTWPGCRLSLHVIASL